MQPINAFYPVVEPQVVYVVEVKLAGGFLRSADDAGVVPSAAFAAQQVETVVARCYGRVCQARYFEYLVGAGEAASFSNEPPAYT